MKRAIANQKPLKIIGLAVIVGLVIAGSVLATLDQGRPPKLPLPPEALMPPIFNLVADERSAVAIATTVLRPIYGEEWLKFESPLRAKLKGSIWVVEGSLPDGYLGGVTTVELSKDDARIIKIYRTQ